MSEPLTTEDKRAIHSRIVDRTAGVDPKKLSGCVRDCVALWDEMERLQAWKDWCHSYLDAHGVPHHPPGTHGAAGCRIGDRMDWLMAEVAGLRTELAAMRREVQPGTEGSDGD